MTKLEDKKLSVEYLYVAVFTTVTVMLWVGFEVVRAITTPAEIPQVSRGELAPLSAELNQTGMEAVRSRIHLSQQVLDEVVVSSFSLTGEETVTETSESATIETESGVEFIQEATTSGTSQ